MSPGANTVAERYLAARTEAKDPIVDYRRAQWTLDQRAAQGGGATDGGVRAGE